MRDALNREIDYVRISVTDRCNLRCMYCMPPEGVANIEHDAILSYEEILRVARCLAALGIRRIKVTGGEPLVRKGVPALIERLKALPDIESVSLTTNGILLPRYATELRQAGLDGVNVSLDTVNPETYRRLTRCGEVKEALCGLDAAFAAGFPTVKVNCVPMADVPGQDLPGVAALARDREAHVRFIEMMPIGCGASFRGLERDRVRQILTDAFGEPVPRRAPAGNGPAHYFSFPGLTGSVGFINTADHAICGKCNRVRLTADGTFKTCLHMDAGTDLRPFLGDDDGLFRALESAIRQKPAHHAFRATGLSGPDARTMSQIGG